VSQYRYVETYKSMVIGEAEKLYDKMVKDLVTVMMEEATILKSDIPQNIVSKQTAQPCKSISYEL
jgi:hypothetical protein